jgi:hypothetical protein
MSVTLPFGQSAHRASILVVDDEPDAADLFRQHFILAHVLQRVVPERQCRIRHIVGGRDIALPLGA